ncbi:zinc permease family [Planoprotostelium fungivorum]|uniref:Zinc permease family n=1 Tax=Planoprotostelium fungivorum TaxID=1890364 RepID=A0A2P6NK53_9EUKA|nr:zinc permease family [Planoprotostelium fungivorum]
MSENSNYVKANVACWIKTSTPNMPDPHGHGHGSEEIANPIELVKFKVICVAVLLVVALIGGLVPLKLRVNERLLSLGNILSGGVFLAAGFTHMLAEAVEGFNDLLIDKKNATPIAYGLCILGMLLLLYIEKVLGNSGEESEVSFGHSHGHSHSHSVDEEASRASRGIKKEHTPASWLNVHILAVLLSAHSIIEGVALGVSSSTGETRDVLIAIAGHKLFDAFAFGVNIAKRNPATPQLIKMVCLFAFMTPLGILLGVSILHSSNNLIAEVVKAVSAGTFIYIAISEIILEEMSHAKDKHLKFILLLVGVSSMILLSTLHGHEHG